MPGAREMSHKSMAAMERRDRQGWLSLFADDGVVEAMERPGLIAVQWHPERLIDFDPIQLKLFEWLVR